MYQTMMSPELLSEVLVHALYLAFGVLGYVATWWVRSSMCHRAADPRFGGAKCFVEEAFDSHTDLVEPEPVPVLKEEAWAKAFDSHTDLVEPEPVPVLKEEVDTQPRDQVVHEQPLLTGCLDTVAHDAGEGESESARRSLIFEGELASPAPSTVCIAAKVLVATCKAANGGQGAAELSTADEGLLSAMEAMDTDSSSDEEELEEAAQCLDEVCAQFCPGAQAVTAPRAEAAIIDDHWLRERWPRQPSGDDGWMRPFDELLAQAQGCRQLATAASAPELQAPQGMFLEAQAPDLWFAAEAQSCDVQAQPGMLFVEADPWLDTQALPCQFQAQHGMFAEPSAPSYDQQYYWLVEPAMPGELQASQGWEEPGYWPAAEAQPCEFQAQQGMLAEPSAYMLYEVMPDPCGEGSWSWSEHGWSLC